MTFEQALMRLSIAEGNNKALKAELDNLRKEMQAAQDMLVYWKGECDRIVAML